MLRQVPEVAHAAISSASQPQLAGKRILVADDNATNRRILTLQTAKWVWWCTTPSRPGTLHRLIRALRLAAEIVDMQYARHDRGARHAEARCK